MSESTRGGQGVYFLTCESTDTNITLLQVKVVRTDFYLSKSTEVPFFILKYLSIKTK